jgi:hypothetical protein
MRLPVSFHGPHFCCYDCNCLRYEQLQVVTGYRTNRAMLANSITLRPTRGCWQQSELEQKLQMQYLRADARQAAGRSGSCG